MIPILRKAMVVDKKWFTDEEMVDIIAICQGLPGVIAVNMATYVGFKKRGFLGSLVATLGVLIPSFVIILVIAQSLTAIGNNPYVLGAMAALRASAAGLIAAVTWQLGGKILKTRTAILAAGLSFVLIAVLKVNIAWVILAYLAAGVIIGIREEGAKDDL